MIKKLAKTLLLIVELILLAVVCWGVVTYAGWSLWWAVVLFAGVLLIFWVGRWLERRYTVWRVRRRTARAADSGKSGSRSRIAALNRRWRDGLRQIRRSRLRKRGGLYALPWYLVIGPAGAGKSTLLARSGLSSSFSPVSEQGEVSATTTLDWWFFDRAILIEPAGRMVDSTAADHQPPEWRRLLDRLMRTRRREPLNGLVLVLPAGRVLSEDSSALADLGKAVRRHVDQLTACFSARIPLYVIISQADKLDGFEDWALALPESFRRQPFGQLLDDSGAGGTAFLRAAFEGIRKRLGEIRIQQGLRGQPSPNAVFFPQRLGALQTALESFFTPAFDATPYSEVPMLRGLFLASEAQGKSESGAWFVRDMFDRVLPADRYHAQPVDRWRYWRRPLTHAAAVCWLVACVTIAALMSYAFRTSVVLLDELKWKNPATLNFKGGFSMDMSAFVDLQGMIEQVDAHNRAWYTWFFPGQADLTRIDQHFKNVFTQRFQSEALKKGVDHLISNELPSAVNGLDERKIAALVELLVNRVDLVEATLAQRPLAGLPVPGESLMTVVAEAGTGDRTFNDEAAARFGELYVRYLSWQDQPQTLATRLLTLRAQLDRLVWANKGFGWVIAWANMQNNVSPVTMADFLPVARSLDVARVPAAYTAAARDAIDHFLDRLEHTVRDTSTWRQWRKDFEAEYRQQRADVWLRFVGAMPSALSRLQGQSEWNTTLTDLFTAQDPFLAMLHRVTHAFDGVKEAPSWVVLARKLNQIAVSAQSRKGAHESALGLARTVNEMGGEVLRQWVHGNALKTELSDAVEVRDAGKLFLSYRATMRGVINTLLNGPGHAYAVAAKFHQFSTDAKIKNEPIHDARAVMDKIRYTVSSHGPRDSEIWQVFAGALDVVIGYSDRAAACQLQQQWEADVASKVGGVTDASLRATLLYGDKGHVSTFVSDIASPFIKRDGAYYRPRSTWGHALPFNNEFFSFLHSVQAVGVEHVASKQQQSALQQADKSAMQTEKEKLAEVQKKIATVTQGFKGVVTVQALPTDINTGAKLLPRRTALTMQCSKGGLTLQNFNFPVSQSVVWTPKSCGAAVLSLDFGAFSVEHRYAGQYGFVDFLRAFQDGSHVFRPSDFPANQQALKDSGIDRIVVVFRTQGGAPLISAAGQLERLQAQEKTLQQASAAAESPGPASGSAILAAMDRELPVPQRIAQCWASAFPLSTTNNATVAEQQSGAGGS